MGLHAAPKLKDESFHFHVEFYPPLRSGDNPKVLAGSESMAGVFIMDVLPEESAEILRQYINK
jgi:UDPglucose--hexose-1-phosphate uridylyltransferase